MESLETDWKDGSRLHRVLELFFTEMPDNRGNLVDTRVVQISGFGEFMETLRYQGVKDSEWFKRESYATLKRHSCGPKEVMKLFRWRAADLKERSRINLPNRAIRLGKDIDLVYDELFRRINVLCLLSPHTFCHASDPVSQDKIDGAMNRLTHDGNYDRRTGDWASCKPYPLVRDGDLRVDVMGYVNLARPRLKVKVHVTNKGEGLEDKLDYEALLSGNEFLGIVHYDVKKPYSFSLRADTEYSKGKSYVAIEGMEMSRNPDNRAIILNMGNGKKRTYDDEIGRQFVAGTFDFWRKHPEVVGGHVAQQLIYAAQRDPRVKEIQEKALKAC